MSDQALYILKKYWRYSAFRPLQDDIINAVLEGKDVLALMPTGGGKSICFQVPGMVMDGLCLVVSPLIALMKDQVENLQRREIKAQAIYSGMTHKEIDVVLDNCIYGNYKFLYVSPERLKTEIFQERLKKMPVNLLAIDEAHCISQWGYDFRPPYLEIAEVRQYLSKPVPTIALTATATKKVRQDILEKLDINDAQVFTKSFARENLSYVVRKTDNKEQQLKRILTNVSGSAVVYVDTRKATYEWAVKLNELNVRSEFYHGGMTAHERAARQQAWMDNRVRAVVATNAFGMGIDKPDVRTVTHLAVPATLEAYYQEAGRAGRDEQRAYATLLYNEIDTRQLLEKIEAKYPSLEYMKKVYQGLANYYKLAVGSGTNQAFAFEIKDFCRKYELKLVDAFHAIKRLEEQGLVQLNEAFYQPSKVMFTVDKQGLYEFQVANAKYDLVVKAILRLYGGEAYINFVRISESQIAQLINMEVNEIIDKLKYLDKQNIIDYQLQKDNPELIFLTSRQEVNKLSIKVKMLEERKSIELGKAKALISYLENDQRCRTLQLLDYFGEVGDTPCEVCDVCLKQKKSEPGADLIRQIKQILDLKPMAIEELVDTLSAEDEEQIVLVVRKLLDQGILKYEDDFKLTTV